MYYISTRNSARKVSGPQAIIEGLAPDGGLYVPETLPTFSASERKEMALMDYHERAAFIMGKFLPELKDGLKSFCKKAYDKFDGDAAPLVKLDEQLYCLELWHGPTHAFKDMALSLLPYLLTESKKYLGIKEKTLILVATSGDTGKAALEGFKDVEGTALIVFYPDEGVSAVQKLQMTTQEGNNVFVAAVKGNFDDAQTAVKKIFSDEKIKHTLAAEGYNLSSANSINWGRLLPQIAYYFSAYVDMCDAGMIEDGQQVDFTVPTGNFGNILAGYYAKRCGLPIRKLVCASNINKVLTDFFETGRYDVMRPFHKTISPSMDILISSNLERLLFEVSGRDDQLNAQRMEELKKSGAYEITKKELNALNEIFYAGFATEEEVKQTVGNLFEEYGYIADPHTCVAMSVSDAYTVDCEEILPMVVVSTASPYKFVTAVMEAMGKKAAKNPFREFEKFENLTALPIPDSLKELENKPVRFTLSIDKDSAEKVVLDYAPKAVKK